MLQRSADYVHTPLFLGTIIYMHKFFSTKQATIAIAFMRKNLHY